MFREDYCLSVASVLPASRSYRHLDYSDLFHIANEQFAMLLHAQPPSSVLAGQGLVIVTELQSEHDEKARKKHRR